MLLLHVAAVKMLQAGRQRNRQGTGSHGSSLQPARPQGRRTFFYLDSASGRVHLMLHRLPWPALTPCSSRTASVQHAPFPTLSLLSASCLPAVWLSFHSCSVRARRRVWQQVAQAVITASMSPQPLLLLLLLTGALLLHKLACAALPHWQLLHLQRFVIARLQALLLSSLPQFAAVFSPNIFHGNRRHKSQITLVAAIRLPCCLACSSGSTALLCLATVEARRAQAEVQLQTRPHCPQAQLLVLHVLLRFSLNFASFRFAFGHIFASSIRNTPSSTSTSTSSQRPLVRADVPRSLSPSAPSASACALA